MRAEAMLILGHGKEENRKKGMFRVSRRFCLWTGVGGVDGHLPWLVGVITTPWIWCIGVSV